MSENSLIFFYYILSRVFISEKRAGMLHIALTPTKVYITLESRLLLPPNIKATRSKLKIPISPQLSPPTIKRAIQIL